MIMCLNVVPAFAAENVKIFVDGAKVGTENLVLKDGTAYMPEDELRAALGGGDYSDICVEFDGARYIPVRAAAERSGMLVTWDDASQSVIIEKPEADYVNKICTIKNNSEYLSPSSPERGGNLTVAENAHEWRFKGFASGTFVFIDENDMAADVNSASVKEGETIIHWTSSGAGNQRWVLEKTAGGFYIKSLSSNLYLTENNASVTQETKKAGLNQVWEINVVGEFEPVVEKMLASDAAKSLPKYKYDRLYASLMSGGEFNFLVYNKVENKIAEEDYFNLPYDKQLEFISECFDVYSVELMSGSMTSKIKRDIKVEYVGIEEGAWESWHGIPKEKPRKYIITVTDIENGDSHSFEYICPYDNDEEYAEKIGEAVGSFDMPIIKCLKRFTYTGMNTSSWNGSNGKIWNNTGYRGDVNNMIQYFAHEIGHVMDTEDTAIWYRAIAQDMIPVTGYAKTNRWEDLAEFSRMYLLAKGDETRTAPIEATFPARTKAYKALLYTKDNDFYPEYKDEYEDVMSAAGDYDKSCVVRLSSGGKYLADKNSSLVLTDSSLDDSVWEVYSAKAGSSRLRNKTTGKYITISDSKLSLGEEGGEIGFKSADGGYIMIETATGFAIDKNLAVTTESGEVWTMEEVASLPFAGDFTIKLKSNGKYLSCEGNSLALSDAPVIWSLNPIDSEYVLVKDKSTGKTIDISGGNEDEGAEAILYSVTGGQNQHFAPTESGGSYKLKLRHSGLYLTYDGKGFCQSNGGSDWILEKVSD